MKKVTAFLFTLAMIVGLVTPAAFAAEGSKGAEQGAAQGPKDKEKGGDDLPNPYAEKQRALRKKALERKLRGDPRAQGKVVEVARGQYVELAREATDKIFVVLAEFGNERHPSFPDNPAYATKFDGPGYNEIPEPDRSVDNTTIWQADYSQQHFETLYFSQDPGVESVANYYEDQSSGRYSVEGMVTDWVKVPYNQARYGRSGDTAGTDPAVCASSNCTNVHQLINDAVDIWVANQKAAGATDATIAALLAEYDVWDRYDFDFDGNFNERDGYIDHFQIVHAGGDEAAGDPTYLRDAIWSHRWAAYTVPEGHGPANGLQAGGAKIGNSDIWVYDYTIQPENGGLGVFAHEYGHDLGLPDLYDTSYAGESASAFWTIMSSGSYMSDGSVNGIGTTANDMGAWEKLQLGWLNYEVARTGTRSSHKLGPAESNTKQAQALITVLPNKQVALEITEPFAGGKVFYSGSGASLDNFMSKQVTLPAGAQLTAKVNYQIEEDWDYAYVVVSTDSGATWTHVPTNLSRTTNPYEQNFGNGITGASDGWVDLTADLSAFSGNVLVGFRYWTDGYVHEPGFSVDEVSIAGGATDGAETDAGWTFKGFSAIDGPLTTPYFNAYIAEFRQYRDYDKALQTGPYNFGFLNSKGDWVEHFPYQDGLLISYWDTSYTDNNVGVHPGGGEFLPIDARPTMLKRADGANWRTRIQVYDATFGLEPSDAITLHANGEPSVHPSQPAVSVFNDRLDWYDESGTPGQAGSANPPKTGTTIEVVSVTQEGFMQVNVKPSK